MSKIKEIIGYEILDSRGIPTLKTLIRDDEGNEASAGVPSGSSAGKFEAWELRDGGLRYLGKGVKTAVDNVNNKISKVILGKDPSDQKDIDRAMMDLDGTSNKKNIGANAILSVSLASARLAAQSKRTPLYEYLNKSFFDGQDIKLPTPFSVVIEAGQHSKSNLEVQEFMVVPEKFDTYSEKLEAMTEIFHKLGKNLSQKGFDANVGLEGAYGPNLSSNSEALDLITQTINELSFGDKVFLALDVASSEFYNSEDKVYAMKSVGISLNSNQMLGLYDEWISKYPIISIEDGLEEESWDDWSKMNSRFSDKIKIIGDDLSVTNPKRVQKGLDQNSFTGCIIKPNQIGTLSETIEVINLLKNKNLDYIISHRGGETDDSFISDLAVASGASYIKTGAPSRGERVAKYNRLLEIERETKL